MILEDLREEISNFRANMWAVQFDMQGEKETFLLNEYALHAFETSMIKHLKGHKTMQCVCKWNYGQACYPRSMSRGTWLSV